METSLAVETGSKRQARLLHCAREGCKLFPHGHGFGFQRRSAAARRPHPRHHACERHGEALDVGFRRRPSETEADGAARQLGERPSPPAHATARPCRTSRPSPNSPRFRRDRAQSSVSRPRRRERRSRQGWAAAARSREDHRIRGDRTDGDRSGDRAAQPAAPAPPPPRQGTRAPQRRKPRSPRRIRCLRARPAPGRRRA